MNSGYTLFVQTFSPLYHKYRELFADLDVFKHSFMGYASYIWKNLNTEQRLRWSILASSGVDSESLEPELELYIANILMK